MTEEQLFAKTEGAYLSLIHLESGIEEATGKISACAGSVSIRLINQLLRDGDSWRERLFGLVLASMRGANQFFDSLICSLHKSGGLSIVPICAALAVAVRDSGCKYEPSMTEALDRESFDGEMGFALDWFHYTIGIGPIPKESCGPNYGQSFETQLKFYASLNKVEQ